MKKIIILTDYRGLYRQDIRRTKGIDLKAFINTFEKAGFPVKCIDYNQLINKIDWPSIKDSYIVYTSSESQEYKNYIEDIMYELNKKNVLIPKFEILKCHENKNFQELYKKELGIKSLNSLVFATLRDLKKNLASIEYPVVIKKHYGAGAISVYRAFDQKQLFKIVKKLNRRYDFWLYYLKRIYQKVKGIRDVDLTREEKYIGRFILQPYVANLDCDWKVLVFGEKYYVLRRGVRDNEFRASGSGKFSYEIPPTELLDFAKKIFDIMKVPFLSLDLCMDSEGNVYLIEFQGLHFGPYTLINSDQYFVNTDDQWKLIEGKSELSSEYANAIIYYINNIQR